MIYVTYYGVTSYVDLMEDGRLKYEEELFDSPAACSLVIKQKQKKGRNNEANDIQRGGRAEV